MVQLEWVTATASSSVISDACFRFVRDSCSVKVSRPLSVDPGGLRTDSSL